MAKDIADTEAFDLAKRSYEGGIDEDARAAYAEVAAKREPAEREPAEREPAEKAPKEDNRDDGRDERGRFKGQEAAPKTDGKPVEDKDPAAGGQRGQEPKPVVETKPDPAVQPVAGAAPPSFSVKTKAEWDKIPEHVRADILKRETEMGQGLAALRDYKDLKPYAEMAQRHNTTIPKALDHFVRMESMIRQNPAAGMAQIAVNMGMNQQQAAKMFADIATKLGGGQPAPSGRPAAAADPLTEALSPVLNQLLGPLMQQVEALKGQVSTREQADRNAQEQSLLSDIERFASDPKNTYYENLAETMTQLMGSGMVPKSGNNATDLRTAYDMAARMHPEVSEALIEQRLSAKAEAQRKAEQDAVAKAKGASRSLTGSRMPGSTTKVAEEQPGHDGASYEADLQADVLRAFRQHQRA